MKRNITHLILLLVIITASQSCTKHDTTPPEIAIEDKDLTACPQNANCQYLFAENAALNIENLNPKAGSNRLFWADIAYAGNGVKLYIITPMEGGGFLLGKKEVLAGRVQVINSCPACNTFLVPYKLIDGYVKGINLTPEKRAGQTKWLLEIKVVLQHGDVTEGNETIFVKQYFHPNF